MLDGSSGSTNSSATVNEYRLGERAVSVPDFSEIALRERRRLTISGGHVFDSEPRSAIVRDEAFRQPSVETQLIVGQQTDDRSDSEGFRLRNSHVNVGLLDEHTSSA